MTGRRAAKAWTGGGEKLDFYDLKGAVEDLLDAMGISARFGLAEHPALHPASASAVWIGEEKAGVLGELHPKAAMYFELPETWLAELDWEVLLEHAAGVKQLRGVPKFPAVARDLA